VIRSKPQFTVGVFYFFLTLFLWFMPIGNPKTSIRFKAPIYIYPPFLRELLILVVTSGHHLVILGQAFRTPAH